MDAGVKEFGHPKTLKDTIEGAVFRAKRVFENCNYSFGIESGLAEVPYSKSGVMDVTACAIYDGREIHIGLSPSFEYPKRVTELILKNGLDASQAFKEAGLTNHPKIGMAEGIVSVLTHGRLTRKEYTKHAIIMAMIHLENENLY